MPTPQPTRAVLITGASTGIGAACAQRLDGLGYVVYAGVRKPEDEARLSGSSSPRLVPIRLDVTLSADIESAARRIDAERGDGGLDGLVNNAGIAVGGPLEFVPMALVREQFDINVLGLLAVTQAILPLLRRARGRIVNIGSIAGITTTPLVGPYCASKHAVEALSDGLRLELAGSGIEVALIEPGAVKTPIWVKGRAAMTRAQEVFPPAAFERYGPQINLFNKLLAASSRRGVSPDAVADAVIHALTADRPKTRYLVGTDARLRAFLARFLPDRAGDALIKSVLRRMERRYS